MQVSGEGCERVSSLACRSRVCGWGDGLSECVCVCVGVWEEEQRRIPTMYVLQVGYMYESVPDV